MQEEDHSYEVSLTPGPFKFHICGNHPPVTPLSQHTAHRHNLQSEAIEHWLCPHKDKYQFLPQSPLKDYLETHCEGFISDPENKYTINYIVLVLLANWGALRLILTTGKAVRATSYIKKAFATSSPVIGFTGLRRRIITQLDTKAEDSYLRQYVKAYNCPLWCLKNEELDILNSALLFNPAHSFPPFPPNWISDLELRLCGVPCGRHQVYRN